MYQKNQKNGIALLLFVLEAIDFLRCGTLRCGTFHYGNCQRTVACSTLFSSAVSYNFYLRISFEGTSLVRRIEGLASNCPLFTLCSIALLLYCSQFSFLNSHFSILISQFSFLNSNFSILISQFSILSLISQVLVLYLISLVLVLYLISLVLYLNSKRESADRIRCSYSK